MVTRFLNIIIFVLYLRFIFTFMDIYFWNSPTLFWEVQLLSNITLILINEIYCERFHLLNICICQFLVEITF